MRHESVCKPFQQPTFTSIIDIKKTTAWGESGFPSEFLGQSCGSPVAGSLCQSGIDICGALRIGDLEFRTHPCPVTRGWPYHVAEPYLGNVHPTLALVLSIRQVDLPRYLPVIARAVSSTLGKSVSRSTLNDLRSLRMAFFPSPATLST